MSTSSRVRSTLAATAALALASSLGLAVSTGPVSLASGTTLQPRSATPPSTTYAIVKTFSVGDNPDSVAINDADDTVYVTNYFSDSLTVFDGAAGMVSTTAPLAAGSRPYGVAVNQIDDTVYVTNRNSCRLAILSGTNLDDSSLVGMACGPPLGVAVDSRDDSVFVANGTNVNLIQGSTIGQTVAVGANTSLVATNEADDSTYVTRLTAGSVSVLSSRDLNVNTVVGGLNSPVGVAVNQGDDTVYVTGHTNNPGTLTAMNGRNTDDSSFVVVGNAPWGVAVDQRDDTVYVASMTGSGVSVINGRDLDDSLVVAVTGQPRGIAVDGAGANQGLVYVTSYAAGFVSVIGRATPSSAPTSGAAADTVTITVDVPQVAYDVDDSTVASVSFGLTPATGLTAGAGDTWTVTAPAGSGTVPVEVTFAGGLKASAGTFSYSTDPPPPVYPPSAPREVSAIPGDGQATVLWTAPASSGSFAVTDYRVRIAPGSTSCLAKAPALSCTITGLTNGTTYTATVEALNGAGWGPASAPSAPFSPSGEPPTPPGPVPVPPLEPGQNDLQVDGERRPVDVEPNATTNGLDVVAEDWTMTLSGLGADDKPLPLQDDSVLVLDAERAVLATGATFLPGSRVALVIDPPTTSGVASRSSKAPWTIGTVLVEADGTFEGTALLPDSVLAGDHVLQAVGFSPTGRERALSVGLVVQPWIELGQGTRMAQGRHDRIRTGGDTGGIALDEVLTPFIRYNGQGSFTTGTATIKVKADGTFTWTRKIRPNRGLTAFLAHLEIRSNEVYWASVRSSRSRD